MSDLVVIEFGELPGHVSGAPEMANNLRRQAERALHNASHLLDSATGHVGGPEMYRSAIAEAMLAVQNDQLADMLFEADVVYLPDGETPMIVSGPYTGMAVNRLPLSAEQVAILVEHDNKKRSLTNQPLNPTLAGRRFNAVLIGDYDCVHFHAWRLV